MPAVLTIYDGENPYWWNSPDIWVVPGNDPNNSPGQPIAGEPAFLWAKVHNIGDTTALGARVNFYWSIPTTGTFRSNSTLVGSSFVDLNPGETKETLCVVPWIPQVVNNGHMCIIVEIIHPDDPLPSPPPDEFHPPTYHQIAQKNLNVLIMKKSMISTVIQAIAPARKEKILHLMTEVGGTLDEQNLIQLGLKEYQITDYNIIETGLSLEPGCDEYTGQKETNIELLVKPGTSKAVYLKVWPIDLYPRTYVLLHLLAYDELEGVNGGITYVIVKAEE